MAGYSLKFRGHHDPKVGNRTENAEELLRVEFLIFKLTLLSFGKGNVSSFMLPGL